VLLGVITRTPFDPSQCGDNTITISVKPAYTIYTECCAVLTLSGLDGASSTNLSMFGESAGFGAGVWDLATKTLEVTLSADLAGDRWHSFQFTVLNQAIQIDSTSAKLSGCGLNYNFTNGISVSGEQHFFLCCPIQHPLPTMCSTLLLKLGR